MNNKEHWNGILGEGEEILWTGSPKDVKLLESASKWKTILLWLIGLTWLVLSVVVVFPKVLTTDDSIIHMIIVMVLIDCLPVLMLTMPVSDCRLLNNRTLYAITNRRVLVHANERLMSLVPESSTKIEVRTRSGNTGNLLLGDAVKKSDSSLRAAAIQGVEKEKGITGLVLYHIEDPQAVKAILEKAKGR